jgi:hypothetical protein
MNRCLIFRVFQSVNNLMDQIASQKSSPRTWFLPAISAVMVAWMIVSYARLVPLTSLDIKFVAASLGPFALAAAVPFFRRSRIGHTMTAVGAALPLFWIYRTESRTFYVNSWIALNGSDEMGYTKDLQRYPLLRIVCVALLIFTLIWALIRLLPSGWQVRNVPVNQRTWPGTVIAAFVIVWWFATFAFPYQQPVIVDAMTPELSILHVEKDGFTFHETSISIYYGGRFWVTSNDRRLFRYAFEQVTQEGALTEAQRVQLKTVQALPDLQHVKDRAPKALHAIHGEGWYTEMGSFKITAFTTENSTPPPAELVAFFRGIVELPSNSPQYRYEVRDVCLGFCYDPKAGLGYRAMNQRCAVRANNKEYCY